MNSPRISPRSEDIDSLLGDDVEITKKNGVAVSLEQKKRLRQAQNANRGRPKADAEKVELKQLNVSCSVDYCQNFEDLSLMMEKTKRTLMEEALLLLFDKYNVTQ